MNAQRPKITAATPLCGNLAGAVSPRAAPATLSDSRFVPCDPSEGYGSRGRCTVCGHGFYGCICDMPDPDVPHVSDMKRIMPRLFEPSGWELAEEAAVRSSFGMPGVGK